MRRFVSAIVLVACAPAAPLSVAAPAVPARPVAVAAPIAPPVVRREAPYPHLAGAELVTEVEGPRCRFGLETPLGPGLVSVKTSVWLVMPAAACATETPDVAQTTDFVIWKTVGLSSSVENPSVEERALALGAPIEFLPPPEGLAIARRLLDALVRAHPEVGPVARRASDRLALYDDRGVIATDRARMLALCRQNNPEACFIGAMAANAREHDDLLAKSCSLGWNDACRVLGAELRSRALDAARRTREVQDFEAFACGLGQRAGVAPLFPYDPKSCATAAIAGTR